MVPTFLLLSVFINLWCISMECTSHGQSPWSWLGVYMWHILAFFLTVRIYWRSSQLTSYLVPRHWLVDWNSIPSKEHMTSFLQYLGRVASSDKMLVWPHWQSCLIGLSPQPEHETQTWAVDRFAICMITLGDPGPVHDYIKFIALHNSKDRGLDDSWPSYPDHFSVWSYGRLVAC